MSLRTKCYGRTIQTKFLYLYFHMVLFVLLFVCRILPLATFGSERIFSGEFLILNGAVALICFVVVVVVVFDSLLWFSSSFGLG